jgi:hypothetical protein
MPELSFQVESVTQRPNAATPQLVFRLRITNGVGGEAIQSMLLRCQIQIEPVRRRYTPQEQQHLLELFGEPERWSQTLRPLVWENLTVSVPGFTGSTVVELLVPCTFDFNVATTKYTYGLNDGELPVSILFSGTVFHQGRVGLQVMQIPWSSEAQYRLPVKVWKEMMDAFYPDVAWFQLRREVFDTLYEYKTRYALANWEQVIERLLGSGTGDAKTEAKARGGRS